MPVLTLHPAECGILDRRTAVARWTEWSFEPAAESYRFGASGLRVYRRPTAPVAVRVPPGAKVEDVATRDGRTVRRLAGLDAEAVHYRAERGEDGYRLEAGDMARRRDADGPTLAGIFEDVPTPGAIEHARQNAGPGLAVVERSDLDATAARLGRLEAAIREALTWLDDEDRPAFRPLTARNILESALEASA